MTLNKIKNGGTAGFTLTEVVIGIFVLALTSLLVARAHLSISKAEDLTKKKSLATQVCLQLMDEMRHLGNQGNGVSSLDDTDDGPKLNPRLSIVGIPPNSPAHQMLLRQVNVFHVPGESLSRRVRVRVFDKRSNAILAETVGFIRIYAEESPSIQTVTTYYLPALQTGGSLNTFLNPHLSDWSQAVSLGNSRDPSYQPKFIQNKAQSPYEGKYTDDPTDRAYLTASWARLDMFNHLERYPVEEEKYTAALQLYQTGPLRTFGQSAFPNWKTSPPLRYLLNEMAKGNPEYRHSLLQNNGIFFVLPPMRNYSDAAKSPATEPFVRAVVHPENIHYDNNQDINLRVYTYVTTPDDARFTSNSTTTVSVHLPPISANLISIERMEGNESVKYKWGNAVNGTDYTIVSRTTETVITLYESPLRHPANLTFPRQGITPQERLYGMEYIPCLVARNNSFQNNREDLADNGPTFTNNTARWIITIDQSAIQGSLLTINTHLGEDAAPHDFPNLSTTYAWVGLDVPLTEQFQLLGDPRHMPYADVKQNQGYNWYFTKVDTTDGYDNFDKTQDGWAYDHTFPNPNVGKTQRLNFDFPRYMDIYRTALMNSNSSLMVGDSSYLDMEAPPLTFVTLGMSYLGFGYVSQNGFPLRCPETAWVPNSNSLAFPNEIAPPTTFPAHTHMNLRLVARTDNSWFCLPWLGELYPDDQFNFWALNGNLPTGPGNFYRAPYSVFSSTFGYSTPIDFSFQTAGAGLSTLVNGNPSAGRDEFVYNPFLRVQTATFSTLWRDIEQIFFNFQGRNSDSTSARFRLDENTVVLAPPGYGETPYRNNRTRVSLVQNFMTPSNPGKFPYVSGILRLSDPININRSAWILLNGNDESYTQYDFLKYGMNRLISTWSFLEMGSPNLPGTIRAQPIPLVSFVDPEPHALINNPSNITLSWKTDWARWDGKPYTTDYPSNFTPANSDVTYTLLYSDDNRITWTDIDRRLPSTTLYQPWSTRLNSPYNWNVSQLPEGRYILRIEAYRTENSQHVAYQERRIEIKR